MPISRTQTPYPVNDWEAESQLIHRSQRMKINTLSFTGLLLLQIRRHDTCEIRIPESSS